MKKFLLFLALILVLSAGGYFLIYKKSFEEVEEDIVFEGEEELIGEDKDEHGCCLLYTSPSPRDRTRSRMPSSA